MNQSRLPLQPQITQADLLNELARRRLRHFMQRCWRNPHPLVLGRHTKEICDRLDVALADLDKQKSTHLIITVPFRHGKSDICSRYFPPYIFGKNLNAEIILATYSADLSYEMSRDARDILRSPEYEHIFPKTEIDPASQAVSRWGIRGRRGKFTPVGLDGSVTGKGAEILIIDDYLKGREEAESEPQREKIWSTFRNNLMTRLAPIHIVLILATRWHKDDLIGRIYNEMEKSDDFPQFETLHFKAKQDDGSYLFPERYPDRLYTEQFAALGTYSASALLQGEPVARGGNLFQVDKIKIVEKAPDDLRCVRFWDLASTTAERIKDDPDYTAGAKVAIKQVGEQYHVYVADMCIFRAEATIRNETIKRIAKSDGMHVKQLVESVGGYKDAFTTIKEILQGISVVEGVTVNKDKVIRAQGLEPVIEAGNFHIVKAPWNNALISELTDFPAVRHDDQTDAISGAFNYLKSGSGRFQLFSVASKPEESIF